MVQRVGAWPAPLRRYCRMLPSTGKPSPASVRHPRVHTPNQKRERVTRIPESPRVPSGYRGLPWAVSATLSGDFPTASGGEHHCSEGREDTNERTHTGAPPREPPLAEWLSW